mmetsp:Transcript_58071/g.124956  ORF Transcript_58071/g.124956 Transcript_58071/m.124956 type:complete len:214 (+) Transcript_58071:1154-1795(+)
MEDHGNAYRAGVRNEAHGDLTIFGCDHSHADLADRLPDIRNVLGGPGGAVTVQALLPHRLRVCRHHVVSLRHHSGPGCLVLHLHGSSLLPPRQRPARFCQRQRLHSLNHQGALAYHLHVRPTRTYVLDVITPGTLHSSVLMENSIQRPQALLGLSVRYVQAQMVLKWRTRPFLYGVLHHFLRPHEAPVKPRDAHVVRPSAALVAAYPAQSGDP